MSTPFQDLTSDPAIHGWLHVPAQPTGKAIALTHGAGANCQSKFLVEMSNALAASGFTVLRFDLPFRRERPHGPPSPATAPRDREALRRAVSLLRDQKNTQVSLGGHSYGGRQASILAAEEPQLADALLLLSYPLHPPLKPTQLRTSHFPNLTTPAFFVHGTRDPFATTAELSATLKLIPAPHAVLEIDAAAHDLLSKKSANDIPALITTEFISFLQSQVQYPI
jgi:predicted alpha/beta-hydrolase family hydrolase